MMKIHKIVASMLVLVAGCALEVEDEDVASQSEALINAPLSSDTSAVGICLAPLVTGPGGEQLCEFGASGTLIAKNLVLTARHLVQGGVGINGLFTGSFSEPVTSPEALNVTVSSSGAVGNPKWFSVNQILVPSPAGPNDIALLILNDKIRPRDAKPVGVDLSTNLAAPKHPTEFTIIGRGIVSYELDAQGQPINVNLGDFQRRILQHVPFVCASDSASAPCLSFSVFAPPPTYTHTLPLEYFSMGPASLPLVRRPGSSIRDDGNIVGA